MQQGQAQKDAFGMFQPAQVGAGGVVETGLRAVIGMGAPADIVQQAGGLDQPQPVGAGIAEQRVHKIVEHFAKAGQAGVLGFGKSAGLDQRVAGAQVVGHLFI